RSSPPRAPRQAGVREAATLTAPQGYDLWEDRVCTRTVSGVSGAALRHPQGDDASAVAAARARRLALGGVLLPALRGPPRRLGDAHDRTAWRPVMADRAIGIVVALVRAGRLVVLRPARLLVVPEVVTRRPGASAPGQDDERPWHQTAGEGDPRHDVMVRPS